MLGDNIDSDSIEAIDLAHRLEDRLNVNLGDDGFGELRSVAEVLARLDEVVVAAEAA